jgi:hypothetical protein
MDKAKRIKNIGSDTQEDSQLNDGEGVASSILEERQNSVEKVTNLYLERLEQEIKNGYRVFNFRDKEYRLYLTRVKEDDMLSRFKSQLVSKLLEDTSIYMKDQLIRRLVDRGVWDDTKEKEETSLRERLGKVMADIMIERAKEKEDETLLRELLTERLAVELKLSTLTEAKNNVVSSSLENLLSDSMHKYKMCLCVKDDQDNPIWNSIEELDNDCNKLFVNNISEACLFFWAGLDPSLFSLAPGM